MAEGFDGMGRFLSNLNQLPTNLENKIIRTELRKSAKVMIGGIKQALPVGEGVGKHGTQKKTVKVRSLKRQKGRIGVGVGAYDDNAKKFYLPFTEYGTKNQPAQGNIRRYADTGAETEFNQTTENIANGLENELKAL